MEHQQTRNADHYRILTFNLLRARRARQVRDQPLMAALIPRQGQPPEVLAGVVEVGVRAVVRSRVVFEHVADGRVSRAQFFLQEVDIV